MTMRNNIQIRAQYNRDRLFMLGLVNHTLTEDSGTEYVFGFGYIIKDFRLGNFNAGIGRNARTTSDLNIRGDFKLRDNRTRISNILLFFRRAHHNRNRNGALPTTPAILDVAIVTTPPHWTHR